METVHKELQLSRIQTLELGKAWAGVESCPDHEELRQKLWEKTSEENHRRQSLQEQLQYLDQIVIHLCFLTGVVILYATD